MPTWLTLPQRGHAINSRLSTLSSFTLLELLTAVAILGIIVAILFDAFKSTSTATVRNENKIEVNQVVRAVLDQLTRDLERTVNLDFAVNMYSSGSGGTLTPGLSGVPTNVIYFLSDLPAPEPNPYGSFVNVGYQIAKTNLTGMADRWVLMRGDDALVETVSHASDWWLPANFNPSTSTDPLAYNPAYWKVLSENIIGIKFAYYTNSFQADDSTNVWNSTTIPNPLPLSVKVTIYAIDTDAYNKALRVDPGLSGEGTNIVMRNLRTYSARIFLPNSTKNP